MKVRISKTSLVLTKVVAYSRKKTDMSSAARLSQGATFTLLDECSMLLSSEMITPLHFVTNYTRWLCQGIGECRNNRESASLEQQLPERQDTMPWFRKPQRRVA
jgi:hypothetical protein